MIEVRDLNFSFGKKPILKNINLKLLSKSFETSKRSCFYLAQFPILSVL